MLETTVYNIFSTEIHYNTNCQSLQLFLSPIWPEKDFCLAPLPKTKAAFTSLPLAEIIVWVGTEKTGWAYYILRLGPQ